MTRKITALITASTMLLSMALPAQAAEERSLKFYFVNTKERIEIVYKRNGRYIPAALKKLNWFLRDWRREEATKIDPRLLDLVWSVYQQMDTREAINVVSAFRSPKTNSMLRSRSRGVAKNSQHTLGKAMDFFIPGTDLAELRAVGLRMEVGGIGFYPSSGSPFVHMDTGGVRHWPRMTDAQLAKVFPRGDTTQIPSSGKRQKRYEESAARQKRIASAEVSPPNQRGGGLFAKVFKRNQEPATIPTTGQTLTSGDDSTTVAQVQTQARASAPPLTVVPRFRPDGVPTQLLPEPTLEDTVQLALADIPAPRPMPADVFARRVAALAEQPQPLTIVSKEPATPAETQKSVQDTWARVGESRSTDVSEIVIAKAAGPVRAGAPDVAQAVMAALDDTRNQPGLRPLDTRVLEAANTPLLPQVLQRPFWLPRAAHRTQASAVCLMTLWFSRMRPQNRRRSRGRTSMRQWAWTLRGQPKTALGWCLTSQRRKICQRSAAAEFFKIRSLPQFHLASVRNGRNWQL